MHTWFQERTNNYHYYRYSALGPVWAEIRAQSGNWYGSGTLHPEGRCAEDLYALKNPMASAGFEPANLGTKGQHATSRPLKPLTNNNNNKNIN
jgi:hypothetical protein